MTSSNSIFLIIFAIISYLIVIDKNISDYITLVSKLFFLNLEKIWWMIKFHPRNPITNLFKKWEYEKIAKELQEEYKKINTEV